MASSPRSRRRQLALFLCVIILPAAVLIALGVQLVRQERALAEQQTVAERDLVVSRARDALLDDLERVRREALDVIGGDTLGPAAKAHLRTPVVLAARADDGVLRLPWAADPRAELGRRSLRSEPFASLVAEGARLEFAGADPTAALARYRAAMAGAEDSVQEAHAELLFARGLGAVGRGPEALSTYRRLVTFPPRIADDLGVPYALYAASRLLDAEADGHDGGAALAAVSAALQEERWRSPIQAYMLRDLLEKAQEVRASDSEQVAALRALIDSEISVAERTMALKEALPGLGLPSGGAPEAAPGPNWLSFGDDWLVGSATTSGGEWGIVAVSRSDAMEVVQGLPGWPDAARLIATASTSGDESIDVVVAGLGIAVLEGVLPGRGTARSRRNLYAAALFLVLGVSLFGAYVVWIDVRRELRTAELRSLFVSSVSHELKTPLTAIRMFAERLQMNNDPGAVRSSRYLGTIVGESERLTRLLDNVLDLSRIEQAEKHYRRDPVDLGEVLDRVVRTMKYPLDRAGFTLETTLPEALPTVTGDSDALEQAVLNLLSNAMKYSGDSRVIELRADERDGEVVIEVRDRGVGIPAAAQARVTERFFRVPAAETEGIPGTGLGLALVEHAVEAHGGRLTLRSVEGEGSTFAIHLPLSAT